MKNAKNKRTASHLRLSDAEARLLLELSERTKKVIRPSEIGHAALDIGLRELSKKENGKLLILLETLIDRED